MDIKKSLGNNLKVIFSVGGWANSQYFSSMVNNDAMFANFVNSIKNLISKYSFDGVDLGMYQLYDLFLGILNF
jgi:chitinase